MKGIHWWIVFLTICYLKEAKTNACSYVAAIGDLYCKDVSIGVLRSGYYPINVTNVNKLRRLNLASANLTSVDYNAFEELTSLVYLEMNGNRIKELDNRLFNATPDLRQLFVARNEIKTLNKELFDSIPELTHLDISGNPLSRLADAEIFKSLNNLLYLMADNINLRRIPTDLFDPLTSLREVRINDNGIQCRCNLWNNTVWAKKKCIVLTVNCHGMRGTTYSRLETYYENRCGPNRKLKTRIKYINRYNPRYHQSYNRRSSYDDPRFEDFDAYDPFRRHGVPIEEDYIYDDTDTNETLSLTNLPTACPKKQCRFSEKLDRMDCEANELTNFRSDNYPFKERGFSELILDNNKLENLEANAFSDLPEITTLSLRKNGLRNMDPGVFKNLQNLVFLDLSDNLLGGLFEGKLFSSQKNLKILHINSNGIGSIDLDLFKPLTSIKRLFMSDNPFDCNCELRPSVTLLMKRKVLTQGTCRYPLSYNGESWNILKGARYCRLQLNSVRYKSQTDSTTLTLIFFGIILLICGTIQLIHYMVNKFYKPKEGDTYFIPEDFDFF